jgi:hypothetical protein
MKQKKIKKDELEANKKIMIFGLQSVGHDLISGSREIFCSSDDQRKISIF